MAGLVLSGVIIGVFVAVFFIRLWNSRRPPVERRSESDEVLQKWLDEQLREREQVKEKKQASRWRAQRWKMFWDFAAGNNDDDDDPTIH